MQILLTSHLTWINSFRKRQTLNKCAPPDGTQMVARTMRQTQTRPQVIVSIEMKQASEKTHIKKGFAYQSSQIVNMCSTNVI